MNIDYSCFKDNSTEDNCKIPALEANRLPILSLTQAFIDRNVIDTRTVTVTDIDNTLVIKDKDGSEIELIHILTVTSIGGNSNSIHFDPVNKILVNFNSLQDFDADLYKGIDITNNFTSYKNSLYNHNERSSNKLTLNMDHKHIELPTPTTLVDIDVNVFTLNVAGISTASVIKDIKTGPDKNISKKLNTIDVVEINASDIGWDEKVPTLHTFISTGPFHSEVYYLGAKASDKIYIPII